MVRGLGRREGVSRYGQGMDALRESVNALAREQRFSGLVRVDRANDVQLAAAYGLADRAFDVPNTLDTRLAIASAVKGVTALVVMSLVEQGTLTLETTARSLLGDDLPLVDDAVTVEQLLRHRSGIGDYIDESGGFEVEDYVLPVPVHRLSTTEGYLSVLDGHPQRFRPGERFSYCNSGFVVLALLSERASGTSFYALVQQRVCAPAGMHDTHFLRSDELGAGVARGYLAPTGLRTNVLHLPVRGSGDGGLYSTADDLHLMWSAMFGGRIVSRRTAARMVRPYDDAPTGEMRYGLGFWINPARDTVSLEGYDAGVSCRTVHDPHTNVTHTVLANTSEGAWEITNHLDDALGL